MTEARRRSGPSKTREERRAAGERCVEVWLDAEAQDALAVVGGSEGAPAATLLRACLLAVAERGEMVHRVRRRV